MKKLVLIYCILLSSFNPLYAQFEKDNQASVEKSTYGLQAGLFGVSAYHEYKLAKSILLKTEIGTSIGLGNNYFKFRPTVSIEPRWYLNLNKRFNKGRKIAGNSGLFLSIKTTYTVPYAISVRNDNSRLNLQPHTHSLSSYLNIGYKRQIGNHFNFEIGAGVGYKFDFYSKPKYRKYNFGGLDLNLNLKIGYRF